MWIEYADLPIVQIIEYFVEGFKPKKGEKIIKYEHFYDAQKATVILKLFVNEEKDDLEKKSDSP